MKKRKQLFYKSNRKFRISSILRRYRSMWKQPPSFDYLHAREFTDTFCLNKNIPRQMKNRQAASGAIASFKYQFRKFPCVSRAFLDIYRSHEGLFTTLRTEPRNHITRFQFSNKIRSRTNWKKTWYTKRQNRWILVIQQQLPPMLTI